MPITLSRQQLSDLYRHSRGFGENALSMITGGIAEPVSGFASLAALARGENAAGARDAVRDAFTYQPRTTEGQSQQRMLGELAQSVVNSAPVRTWQRGVDYAGRASPVAGATLQTVPAAIGALAGYKPAMQTGQAVSRALAQAQRAAMENAMRPRVLHPQRGVFAGINAKTADLNALESAKQMTASGVPADEVWLKTGWGVGADGKWRFEIDDSSAQLKMRQVSMDEMKNIHGDWIQKDDFLRRYEKTPEANAMRTMNSARSSRTSSMPTLDQAIGHDELFAGYPELRSLLVHVDDKMPIGEGGYAPMEKAISLSPMHNNEMKSVLKHEIQHAIQQQEGFSAGGSPNQMAAAWSRAKQNQDFYSTLDSLARTAEHDFGGNVDAAAKILNELGIDVTQDHIDELMRIGAASAKKKSDQAQQTLRSFGGGGASGDAGMNLYQRLAGEVEARNVQARANMSAQERRATHPRKTADVAEKDQIR